MERAIIYKTTNLINGKFYVGYHKTDKEDGYLGSGLLLEKAVKKYGRKNFKREILEYLDISEKNIWKDREYFWIETLNARNLEIGYNLAYGGGGLTEFTKERKDAIKKRMIGKKLTEEQKRKISEANKGKKLSKETIEKLRQIHLGKKLTEEHKKRLSECRKGKSVGPMTEEQKIKISVALTSKEHPWQDKVNKNPEKIKKTADKHRGMKRSEDSVKKMSDAAKKRIERDGGPKNKGKLWINNPDIKKRKYISKDEPLPEGFFYGLSYNIEK